MSFVQTDGQADGRTHRDEEFLISNFLRILNIVFFLLGDFPASKLYIPTLRKIQTPGNHPKEEYKDDVLFRTRLKFLLSVHTVYLCVPLRTNSENFPV